MSPVSRKSGRNTGPRDDFPGKAVDAAEPTFRPERLLNNACIKHNDLICKKDQT